MKIVNNITKGLKLSFGFLIATLLVYGLYSIYEVKQVANLTRTIYNHPLVVSNAALQAKASVTKMHLNMKDVVLFYSQTKSERYIEAVNKEEVQVYRQLDIVKKNILGDEGKALESMARKLFDEWRPIRNEVVELVKQNQFKQAANITVGKGANHVAALNSAVERLTNYALGMASKFVKQADEVNNNATTITLIFLLISIAVAVVVALFTIKRASVAAEMLRKSEKLFRTMFEQAPLGIAKIDSLSGKIYEANARFAEIAGRTKEEISATDWMSITHPDDIQEDLDNMSLLNAGKIKGFDMQKRYIHPDGSFVWINLTVAPIKKEIRNHPVHLCMIEDITQRKQTEQNLAAEKERLTKARKRTDELLLETQKQREELKAANEGLEEQSKELKLSNDELEEKATALANASKYKSEFLANVSHELRSPLNSMLLLVRCLADNGDGNLTSDQVEQVSIIKSSGTELLYLINDILDFSKVEMGQLDINEDVISLEPFCHSLGTSFAMQAAEKGLNLKVECDSELPQFLLSDEQRLRQIIKNLLSNALKFTSDGDVVLDVRSVDNDTIAFAVCDSGIGIPLDKQQAIFEAFQQADGSTTRKYGGTGLGLTISRKLTGLLGGSIDVKSEEGKGSVFTVILPTKGVTEKSQEYVEEALFTEEPASINIEEQEPFDSVYEKRYLNRLSGRTILVVDDDMRNTFAISALLKKAGVKTVIAQDGMLATDRLSENHDIDLVLMDMMMPGMDGYEATRRIRSMDSYKKLPIIAVTAKVIEGEREKCLAAGANDYMAKPVDKDRLFEMISGMLA